MHLRRAKSYDANLRSNAVRQKQVIDIVEKLLLNKHAEFAPELLISVERWYLPMFAVKLRAYVCYLTHPQNIKMCH